MKQLLPGALLLLSFSLACGEGVVTDDGLVEETDQVDAITSGKSDTVNVVESAPTNATNFRDLNNYPGRTEVLELVKAGVISGYPDGTFRPYKTATRAEVAAVIANAFGKGVNATYSPFSDMRGHWANGAVAVAHDRGFLNGYSDGSFRPNNPMTRQEVLVALSAGLGLEAEGGVETHIRQKVQGGTQVADWAMDRVAAAFSNGLMNNPLLTKRDFDLDPLATVQRGQLASFVYFAMDADAASKPFFNPENKGWADYWERWAWRRTTGGGYRVRCTQAHYGRVAHAACYAQGYANSTSPRAAENIAMSRWRGQVPYEVRAANECTPVCRHLGANEL